MMRKRLRPDRGMAFERPTAAGDNDTAPGLDVTSDRVVPPPHPFNPRPKLVRQSSYKNSEGQHGIYSAHLLKQFLTQDGLS